MEMVDMIKIIIIILAFIVMILACVYAYMIIKKNKSQKSKQKELNINNGGSANVIRDKVSIYNFMDFDEIKDNMIIRKNRSQYIMVVKCKGVNYDLMSEE